ncbi:hypothetical protein [Brevundimonas naejangsanensis]|uniref:hypothetical protein n=1 Tax=Brevundimonas naejangsanensis TaxID=588932 RepID=UPI0026EF9860|nr:hypothetical protein [Brevundimonas naejangsanensis]
MPRFIYQPSTSPDPDADAISGVEVDAVRWTGTEIEGGAPPWLPAPTTTLDLSAQRDTGVDGQGNLLIQTPNGLLRAEPGSWVVRRIEGQSAILSLCAQGPFTRFYRPVV